MSSQPTSFIPKAVALAFYGALAAGPQAYAQAQPDVRTMETVRVLGTAEDELRQAPGVSTITEQDLKERPPANDLAEIIRTMPGVNLTGNSASGAYGNSRQIDLRGMGPENTMILIDGKPVMSRNAVRMGRSGERNGRGDTNWVPAEAVERIEVLRGPAAARYGSGAAGGVVNIITKRPTDTLSGSVTVYQSLPEHNDEGKTQRLGFTLMGPLSEQLSFRLYGNMAKTDPDAITINADASNAAAAPGGREGTRNKDIGGLLRWDINPNHVIELEGGVSRQGGIYAGEYMNGGNTATQTLLAGQETNVMIRRTGSLTHRGKYGPGQTSRLTVAYEGTTNQRLNEGLAGSGEGTIGNPNADTSVSQLQNFMVNGEFNTPLKLGNINQVLTVGGEWRQEKLHDPYSVSSARSQYESGTAAIPVFDEYARARSVALFVESNIAVLDNLILTPGLRYDHHDKVGSNWSPSLNASWYVTPEITVKGGIARAFKVPNLYQSNPSYLYTTRGNGCPPGISGPCWILGNPDLRPETSINKEIGIAYDKDGWGASLTYFQNDYKNKIVADMGPQGVPPRVGGAAVYQWMNSGAAVVRGLEGHLNIPILGEDGNTLKLINNFTYMIHNKSKETGQPLSMIPRYTINSTLDWQATEKVSVQATATFYGKQKPRTLSTNNVALTGDALNERKPYAIFGLGASYQHDKHLYFRAGVNNLFDKRLYREASTGNAGANTYNEPGRTFYLTMTGSF